MDKVPPSERASNMKDLDLNFDELPMEWALGLQWSVESDTLHFSYTSIDRQLSRRSVLATVASLYDPLGLIAPYTLQGKKILQRMCSKGTGWDDPPSEDLLPTWETWKADLKQLKHLTIPRCYYPHQFGTLSKLELHHFADTSTTGYGACTYLRVQNTNGDVHCSLVFAKARVAPIKLITIPRLELSAAPLAAEVSAMLKQELTLEVNAEFFWTDSRVMLGYLNNEARKFHVFVANRVQRIRRLTNPQQWRYVSTCSNPADYASRGLTVTEMTKTCWYTGPAFLWQKKLDLPQQTAPELQTGDPEVRTTVMLTTHINLPTFEWNDRLDHLSTWTAAQRAVARILRLVDTSPREPGQDQLSTHEIRRAEFTILNGLQGQAFPKERKLLSINTPIPRTNKLHQVDAFLQDGIIRVGGRLKEASMSEGKRHPIILPREGHLTNLVIDYYHRKVHHQGRGMTQNAIRSHGYWIVGGSRAVARRIKKCVTCRKVRRPNEEQRMADLPKERVTPSPPFTYTGLDCFGPFLVKNGRREVKRYGLVFTCYCSQAVHIEMIDDLSTDGFLNGLHCFIAVRGAVTQICSDQGTNFVGAKSELDKALQELDTQAIQRFLAAKQCSFIFNAPKSSHAGGLWKRQIRTIRNILSATIALCPGRLDDASLRTLFCEAMAIINPRPLTVENINDPTAPAPLTPNHLLTMKATVPLPPSGKFCKEDMYLRKRWRRVQYLAEQFWARWRQEYVHNISQRQKWHSPRRNLMVGDIVLIMDHESARNKWPLGRICDVTQGDDGLVRV